jgi:hypothetical protein
MTEQNTSSRDIAEAGYKPPNKAITAPPESVAAAATLPERVAKTAESEQCRAAFEAWIKSEYPNASLTRGIGGYERISIDQKWIGWRARDAAAASAAPAPKVAMAALEKAIHNDPDYAWSWHCNIACAAMDEGLERVAANRAAARFMYAAFDCDTTKLQHYTDTQTAASAAPAEPNRNMEGAENFVRAIMLNQPIWPNKWGQDVAAAAFFLTDNGTRATAASAAPAEPAFYRARYLSAEWLIPADQEPEYRAHGGWELTPLYTAPPTSIPPNPGELKPAAANV